jgi:hypothetical protein
MPIGRMHKERKAKNVAVALLLVALVALFFVLTLVKLGSNVP